MGKVIFLDFDGVLNSWKYTNIWLGNCTIKDGYIDRDKYGFLFDKNCVLNLKNLIDKASADIVISSSWRHLGLEKIKMLWNDRQLPGEVIGIIPKHDKQTTGNSESLSRGECIQLWLEENPIESYVILDDNDDFLEEQKQFWVQTNGDIGFSEQDLAKALDVLTKKKILVE
jgi:HAD domain in Swiss Army Knife RNA repair proteins